MATPKAATKLSDSMYLFKSTTNYVDCLISAHGGYIRENRSFDVPSGVTVLFYGAHGHALNDPGIGTLSKELSKAVVVDEIRDEFLSQLLSASTGGTRGASGKEVLETYDQIASSVDRATINGMTSIRTRRTTNWRPTGAERVDHPEQMEHLDRHPPLRRNQGRAEGNADVEILPLFLLSLRHVRIRWGQRGSEDAASRSKA